MYVNLTLTDLPKTSLFTDYHSGANTGTEEFISQCSKKLMIMLKIKIQWLIKILFVQAFTHILALFGFINISACLLLLKGELV